MSDPGKAGLLPVAELPSARPTWVRWRIVMLLMAYSAMCHFNRISMSVAGNERIRTQYGFEDITIGWIYFAYLIAYTLCMTPGGWLIDRWGPKAALAAMGFGSAIFVVLTGLSGLVFTTPVLLLVFLLLIRSLMGIANAPMHPAAARAVSFWIPFPDRTRANGLVTGAACVGIACTYVIFGFLIDEFGWPKAFLIAGIATAALAALWQIYATDRPTGHRSVNGEEARIIEPAIAGGKADERISVSNGLSDAAKDAGRKGSELVKPLSLLRNRSLVLLTLSYAAVGYFQYLFFYWMERYFGVVLHLNEETSRFFSTICTLAMGVGMVLGGWLGDRAQGKFGIRRGRRLVPMAGLLGSAVFLGLGLLGGYAMWVVFCFGWAMGCVGAAEGPSWNTAVELGGRRGGAAAGIFNTGGNILGALSTVLTPFLSQSESLGWRWGFALAGFICLAGALLWLWIDPSERIAET
ncbi:MAG: MFS transporter [Gemmataceae bacterium]